MELEWVICPRCGRYDLQLRQLRLASSDAHPCVGEASRGISVGAKYAGLERLGYCFFLWGMIGVEALAAALVYCQRPDQHKLNVPCAT